MVFVDVPAGTDVVVGQVHLLDDVDEDFGTTGMNSPVYVGRRGRGAEGGCEGGNARDEVVENARNGVGGQFGHATGKVDAPSFRKEV